jgi:peroxiredoxin Q/BCP
MKSLTFFGVLTLLFAFAQVASALTSGEKAPDFAAKNQDGKVIHLSDFKGKPVIIYFYPKDDTPGCTKEACNFRDEYSKFQSLGAVVLGVSRQNESSHKAFKSKYHLPFDLLADTDGKLAQSFGIAAMPVVGFLKRESVLIGSDGKVIRFYPDVDPATHTATVIQDLEDHALHANKQSG